MAMMRMHITGDADQARALINLLTSLEGIEHVEEVSDLMPHRDDDDSSSAELPDDMAHARTTIEVDAGSRQTAERVRECALKAARDLELAVEFDSDEPTWESDPEVPPGPTN